MDELASRTGAVICLQLFDVIITKTAFRSVVLFSADIVSNANYLDFFLNVVNTQQQIGFVFAACLLGNSHTVSAQMTDDAVCEAPTFVFSGSFDLVQLLLLF